MEGGGSWDFTKVRIKFVYQPILMKFSTIWFFGLPKPNLMLNFQNNEKVVLGEGERVAD